MSSVSPQLPPVSFLKALDFLIPKGPFIPTMHPGCVWKILGSQVVVSLFPAHRDLRTQKLFFNSHGALSPRPVLVDNAVLVDYTTLLRPWIIASVVPGSSTSSYLYLCSPQT